MTPSPLRELAAEMRRIAKDIADAHINGFGNQISDCADKLESLAGEWAVVPREANQAMCDAATSTNADLWATDAMDIYRAMIEAAERQETGR